jgi:hypothetical protein
MTSHGPRYPRRATAPSSEAVEQLTPLVYELLDAHDDTARLATGQELDPRWQAHLGYLRDLQRVAREQLAHAGQRAGAQPFAPADAPTREAGMFRRFGRLSIRILPGIVDHAKPPPTAKAAVDETSSNRCVRGSSPDKTGSF